MLLRAFLLLLFALLAVARGGEAVPAEMLFRNWSTREGLPQDHVRAILRTRDGFLWLGTDAGLARFDGLNFKTFGLSEGLGSVAVLALLEARDGTLWIATQGGYLSTLRDGQIERTYDHGDLRISGASMSLAQDAEGRIWVAGRLGMVWLENDRFTPVRDAPHADELTTRILFCDRKGGMWVSFGSDAIARWQTGKWSRAEPSGPQRAAAFCEDGSGRLWIGDNSRKLWCREETGWRSFPLPESAPGRISSISAAPDGTVWAALLRSSTCGLRDGQFIAPVIRGEKFLDLTELVFVTPDGQLWLGSSTNGLYLLNPRRIAFEKVDDQEANKGANFIGALIESTPGEFFIGTQGRGFYRWHQDRTEPVEELPELNRTLTINALRRTRDGSIWAASSTGFFQFRDGQRVPKAAANTVPGNAAWDLCEDRQGGLWVGTGNGELYYLDESGAQKRSYGGDGDPIKGLAQEADGTLWIGTRGNGLFRLRGADWHRFGTGDGLPGEIIRVLYVSPGGTLWAGTAGGGLAVRKDGRFHAVTTQEGLPDDTVSQITTDEEGRIWVGTNRGLAVFSAEEVARIQAGASGDLHPLIVTRTEGLLSEECTITPPVKCADGRYAFATTQGFALLRPGDFHADENAPPVFIDHVFANGRTVAMDGEKLSLPPGIERLEFDFTGLHFGTPERLRFRNRLAGVDLEWGRPGPERKVEYRNLAPGTYRFDVAATSGNGRWTSHPATLEITLAPRIWQTGWFLAAAIAGAAGLIALAVHRFERQRMRRKLEAMERQQALHAERARIARDLHDDIGSTLTQVALLSELAQSDLASRPERASGHINDIFSTAKAVTRALDEIVWAINPAQDTLESFIEFLGTFVQNYTRTAGLYLRLDFPATVPATPLASAIRHHLYLAAKEILHNIVKHANAHEIRIRLTIEGDCIRLAIEDDGRGFDAAILPVAPGSDGLLNLQRRLEQVGGTCTRRSAPGTGTAIEMLVPLAHS